MATDPYWQLEKEYTTISDTHNLIIKAVSYEEVRRTENDRVVTDSAPCKVHEFRVEREVLSAASPVFRKLLGTGFPGFKESEQTTVELHEDYPNALETWFKIFHSGSDTLEGVEFAYLDISLKDVWELLSTAHKYEIDPKGAKAKTWFKDWYLAQSNNPNGRKFGYLDFQALIFPCEAFDYAPGFLYATKQLVYRSNGHITERQPEGFKQDNLHLSSNIIQQLNSAKGRLKTVLHRDLYNPIDGLLNCAQCNCKPHVLYAYEQALANTGAWPIETSFAKSSVNEILRLLENFRAFQPQTCGSGPCTFNFLETVRRAVEKTKSYFDGLCLDCISLSHPKLRDHDEDYWHHAKLNVAWDRGCRVRHKQPSWYFSFMGRRQKMVQWTRARRNGGGGGGFGGEGYE